MENGRCYKCEDKYYLNESGLCDLVIDGDTCLMMGTLIESNDPYVYLNTNPYRLGCIKCASDYRAVSFSF